MQAVYPSSNLPKLVSPYSYCRDILIAAEGPDMTYLARQLLSEGHRIRLCSEPQATLDYLKQGKRPSVIIVDPDLMAANIKAFRRLSAETAIIAVTSERRPQRLIDALNAGLYVAWLSRPCDVSDIYPVIIEQIDRIEARLVTKGLTVTIMLATHDMLHAARKSDATKELYVKGAMDIAAAAEDYRALNSRDLFYCPTRMGAWALFGPMRERWIPLATHAGLCVDWPDLPATKVYCDAPLVRRAMRVILGQAVRYSGQDGTVRIHAEVDMQTGGTNLTCSALRRADSPAAAHRNYRAFAETFAAHVAKINSGVFSVKERRREYTQTLSLTNNPPIPDKV